MLPETSGLHSISLSTVASSLKKYGEALNVIWIDAHADIHTRKSSETKNTHGMPLGSLLGHDPFFNFPTLLPSQLTYIGLRDVDMYEKKVIYDNNITNYDMDYIKTHSIYCVVKHISKINGPIHLSFDVDSIDPDIFKCTGTPVKAGLNMTDIWKILSTIKDKTVSCDFVEFNPFLANSYYKRKDVITLLNIIDYMS